MAQDFGWSPTVAGLVQSSFFYGYILSQVGRRRCSLLAAPCSLLRPAAFSCRRWVDGLL